MPRRPSGAVVDHQGRDGFTYRALRFTAYGKRRFLRLGPVTREEAERELRHVLADVERGTWKPAEAVVPPPEAQPMPTFHEYAERWWTLHSAQLAPSTCEDYRWRLERHLLPYFETMPLNRITVDEVERYVAGKLAEDDPLSPRSINMTVTLLGAILETAVERDLLPRNPARGKRRRVKERAPQRSYLDAAWQIEALLDAAGALDRESQGDRRRQHVERRATLATLTFAGLRIGELCALRWRDVYLATGWLHVGESKTDAGRRRVKLRGALRDELAAMKARVRHGEPGDYVFATSGGTMPLRENLRNRVLAPAVKRANEQLAKDGESPLPDRITPHSLRRTFAGVLYALGEDPGVVMDEMGHTDPALALRVYRQTMRRDDDEKARLRALVEGHGTRDGGREMADIGRREAQTADSTGGPIRRAERETA